MTVKGKLRVRRRLPKGVVPFFAPPCPSPFLIDRRFLHIVQKYAWTAFRRLGWRARARFGGERRYLHRFVLALGGSAWPSVCFKDGDTLNCTLANLAPYRPEVEGASRRWAARAQGPGKGVGPVRRRGCTLWRARLRWRTRLLWLGLYATAEEAAAVCAAAGALLRPDNQRLPSKAMRSTRAQRGMGRPENPPWALREAQARLRAAGLPF